MSRGNTNSQTKNLFDPFFPNKISFLNHHPALISSSNPGIYAIRGHLSTCPRENVCFMISEEAIKDQNNFIYERRDEVLKSSYYQKMAQLAGDVDQFYRDLVENDMSTNIQKYYGMLGNFLIHEETTLPRTPCITKLDGEKAGPLRGNPVLRAQIKVSKKILGYCTPLALGTHGTVFNGKKLQNKREQIVNTFARLFSRRIVKASEPPPCQTCYCSGTKDMTGHLKCLKCDYQTPSIQNQVDLENETEE